MLSISGDILEKIVEFLKPKNHKNSAIFSKIFYYYNSKPQKDSFGPQ